MTRYPHAPHSTGPSMAGRIASSLGIGELSLNELDFDDLFVSEVVHKTLEDVAEAIRVKPAAKEVEPGLSAYWVQDSKELVLCASLGTDLHLVRVPDDHWTLKPRTTH